jgi:hypothetical protein
VGVGVRVGKGITAEVLQIPVLTTRMSIAASGTFVNTNPAMSSSAEIPVANKVPELTEL